jgi:membrane protease YdiL (CAAX protease family)
MDMVARSLFNNGLNELINPQIRLDRHMNTDLKTFARRFGIGTLLYLAGSIIPAVLILAVAHCLNLEASGGKTLFVLTVVASFICGFGWQLLYLNKSESAEGPSLRQIVERGITTFRSNWKKSLAYAGVGIVISSILDAAISHVLVIKPHQIAAELAAHLHGVDLVVFALLAAVVAPIVEETLFRGYVFNALRSGFARSNVMGGKMADLWAILLSAALFAGMHMEPSAFLQLFVFGIILAEVYRRSGTIVCPMLLHALNNSIAVSMLLLQ